MKFLPSRFLVLAVAVTLFDIQPISAQVVEIPDLNLESAIREELKLPNGTPITQQEMLKLERLDAGGNRGITDLTGLEYATNLKSLGLYHNPITDIGPFTHLTQLEGFNLWGCRIVDLSPLRNLKNLTSIILGNNQISELSPLSELTNLSFLELESNQISDVNPLAGLINLTVLEVDSNRIVDISPLANLIRLENLRLDRNAIMDITPLAGLKNLKKLYLAENPIHDFSPLAELEGVELDLEIDLSRLDELNIVVEVPDPNLEQAIRETLSLPDGMLLTQTLMLQLTGLETGERGIIDLTGIEHATNLHYLNLGGNQIRDIRPLSALISLTGLSLYNNSVTDIASLANLTNLTYLNLAHNGVETLEPLSSLIRLQTLDLFDNRVRDITPVVNMTALTALILTHNQVGDLTPLANHPSLEKLYIRDNLVADFSPLNGLNLIELEYDEPCNIAPILPSVRERIESRSFPSVFQAWDDIVGLDRLTSDQRHTLHDLHWSPFFGLGWRRSAAEPTYGIAISLAGDLAHAREIRQRRLKLNPNMVFLVEIRLHNHFTPEAYPPDSDFWLRDAQGRIIKNSVNEHLINFLKPEVQDLLAKRITAIAQCGLYDGVFIDGFARNGTGFVGRHLHSATDEEIIQAMLNIFSAVRSQTREDFLIIMNANNTKPTRYAEFVNGTFMETGKNHPGGYTEEELQNLEGVLSWAEKNLQPPQITCLEGEGLSIEPPDGPDNLRWMRLFTTLSLTHSNGYVLYTTGFRDLGPPYPHHDHLWHPFWDANLGRPVGAKAHRYQDVKGLFIREFTNGWAVYNRSGQTQTITLLESATPVSDRGNNSASLTHLLPDLDGEIYLTTKSFADVNSDGHVNILDLVQVANGFGKSSPDPNDDGTVNILDIVFVASHFTQ